MQPSIYQFLLLGMIADHHAPVKQVFKIVALKCCSSPGGLPSSKQVLATSFRSASRLCRSSLTWLLKLRHIAGRQKYGKPGLLRLKNADIDRREHPLMA